MYIAENTFFIQETHTLYFTIFFTTENNNCVQTKYYIDSEMEEKIEEILQKVVNSQR